MDDISDIEKQELIQSVEINSADLTVVSTDIENQFIYYLRRTHSDYTYQTALKSIRWSNVEALELAIEIAQESLNDPDVFRSRNSGSLKNHAGLMKALEMRMSEFEQLNYNVNSCNSSVETH